MEVDLKTYVIGRSAFADIVLADESVAPRHAEVVVTARWEPIRQAFVLADEPLRLGEHLCTLKDLLRTAAEAPVAPGTQPAVPAVAGAEAAPRVRGRVERDAKTGEIVRKRP
jgi:hypothetical protein